MSMVKCLMPMCSPIIMPEGTSHYRQDFVLLAEQLFYQGDTTEP